MSAVRPAPEGYHTDDALHVIMDALESHRHALDVNDHRPWTHYTGEPTDCKMSEQGYRAVLARVDDLIVAMLNHKGSALPGDPQCTGELTDDGILQHPGETCPVCDSKTGEGEA